MSMKFLIRSIFCSIFFFSVFASPAWSQEFQVEDIRIEGLKRVSANTVFAALPIKVDDTVSTLRLQEAVREMFKTGFFSDIDINRDGNVLVLNVVERPSINTIQVSGNSVIETEPLLNGLRSIGLKETEIFKQSSLEQIERELNAQYSAVGRYATKIETEVIELDQNQVNIAIYIIEGKVASIKHINIVGNKDFTEKELQVLFEIQTTGTWSWITGNDKYAQQKLAGDIERLKGFYFDRGYLEFESTSTQVSLSPDKESVYITVNVFEGQPYTIENIELAGDLIVSEDEISPLVGFDAGDVFSQTILSRTSNKIEKRLGNEGYSYARVRGVPDLDKESKTVDITLFVDPGSINYVRRISFRGNEATQDDVLRREMRQLEGAPVSTDKLAQSKVRLERLSFFSNVSMDTQEVPGRPDQIDVIFTVVEQPSGSINGSIGFSQGSGIVLGAGLEQTNWLGTGNTLAFQVNQSDVDTDYSVSFQNPYFTKDGISRGVSLFYRQRDLSELNISSYSSDRLGVNFSFGYPISEQSRISFGVGVENISINVGAEAVQEISGSPRLRSGVDDAYISNADYQTIASSLTDSNANGFFDENDNVASGLSSSTSQGNVIDSTLLKEPSTGFIDQYGDDFNALTVSLGWSGSDLNRGVFPTSGSSQKLNLELSTPGGDLEYYKVDYSAEFYRSITDSLTMRFKSRLGYAGSYGNLDTLPFFENFFSGGSSSIRGFKSSSLGPKGTPAESYIAVPYDSGFAYVDDGTGTLLTNTDDNIQTLGGNVLFETGVELIFPVPFAEEKKSLRTLFFVDAGNVFSDSCSATQANCSNLDFGKLSSSMGLGVQWLSPVGPISMYFSKTIQEQEHDQSEGFQFSLGQRF